MNRKRFILICIFCWLLAGCQAQGQGNITFVSSDGAFQKMEQQESFLLLITRDSCTHCDELKQMLKEELKHHTMTIYELELDESTEENFMKEVAQLEEKLDKPARTPHLYFIEKGEVKDEFVGYKAEQKTEFWDFVEKTGVEK